MRRVRIPYRNWRKHLRHGLYRIRRQQEIRMRYRRDRD